VGDHFYLYENKILCGPDYEERMVFANLSANPAQLAQLKSQTLGRSAGGLPPSYHSPPQQQSFHHYHNSGMPLPPAKGEASSFHTPPQNQQFHQHHHSNHFAGHPASLVQAAAAAGATVGPQQHPDKDMTPLPPISSVRSNVRALQT
jgi:hypothetical protein